MKMNMKHILTALMLLAFQAGAFSQIIPSVYTGIGNGTNLGGEFGLGVELRYKKLSLNAAVGRCQKVSPKEFIGIVSPYGYDVGVKYYLYRGLFLGVDYGCLDNAVHSIDDCYPERYEKTYGVSIAVGYKWSFYKNLYIQPFVGLGSNNINYFVNFLHGKTTIPRLGILVGYSFIRNEKEQKKL